MIEREVAKLQKDVADLAALASVINVASEMSLLGHKLIVTADKITDMAGALAERSGYSTDELFGPLWDA